MTDRVGLKPLLLLLCGGLLSTFVTAQGRPDPSVQDALRGLRETDEKLLASILGLREEVAALRALISSRPDGIAPTRPASTIPPEPISLQGAALWGAPTAQVAIIEYSDFECPYCRAFARDTLPLIHRDLVDTGKVLFAFRHLPLESIHRSAIQAARAAECAGQQGKFWSMHDLMFAEHASLDLESLRTYGESAGLKLSEFDRCLSDGSIEGKVRRDIATARTLGVSGTPTFMVGLVQPDGRVKVSRELTGAQPIALFTAIVDGLLKQARGKN